MPENMLIPPLCEQLIGHCAAHQAVREGEVVGLDASAWHSVHHRPHLATPSRLAASERNKREKKRHTFVSCPSVHRHVYPRDVRKEMLAQLANCRDRDQSKDTH